MNLNDWKEAEKNPDGSTNKFKTALKDLSRKGHIGFQNHGQVVWFRKIRIKESFDLRFLFSGTRFLFPARFLFGRKTGPVSVEETMETDTLTKKIPPVWNESDYRWSLPLKESGHGSPGGMESAGIFEFEVSEKREYPLSNLRKFFEWLVEWSRNYVSKTHKTHRFNSFASSTPAVDSRHVYSVWGHSTELMVSAHNHQGELIWEKIWAGSREAMALEFLQLFMGIF